MSHFAHINNGIVDQVIVAESDFIFSLSDSQDWVQTSYNTRAGVHYSPEGIPDDGLPIGMNYAGVGYTWDGIGFAPPQPFPSWQLNSEKYIWEAPIPYPDNGDYLWDEDSQSWVEDPLSTPSSEPNPTPAE
jgi:hypothetical protein